MDYLLEFSERGEVQELARRYLEHADAVQGIAVDLDDLWLAAWRLYNSLPASAFESELRLLADVPLATGVYGYRYVRTLHDEFVSYPYGIDPNWRTPLWEHVMDWRGGGSDPFVMIVVLRPEFSEKSLHALREIDTGGVQVRFEVRPTPELYAAPKDRVRPMMGGVSVSSTSGSPGTLGGILEGEGGTRFGLTCSHVMAARDEAQQPSPADNRRDAERIGDCVAGSTLNSHSPPLDPYDASINSVDASLVELEPGVKSALELLHVGALTGIAPKSQVHPSSSVDVVGKEVGLRSLYIGAVTLVQEFDFRGEKYGYRNMFELRRASRFAPIVGMLSRPVKPGDSGAWVLRQGEAGAEWLGVVVGGQGPFGYAIPAEFVVEWIENDAGIGSVGVC